MTSKRRQDSMTTSVSAIHTLTIPKTRQGLAKLREVWQKSRPEAPLFTCNILFDNWEIGEFTTAFNLGKARKRQGRPDIKKSKSAHESDSEESSAENGDEHACEEYYPKMGKVEEEVHPPTEMITIKGVHAETTYVLTRPPRKALPDIKRVKTTQPKT